MVDMKAVEEFRARALSPEHPTMRGSHENGDIFFQNREASNKFYDAVPGIVEDYMKKINRKLGTDYQLFNYYGAPDADRVIIAMGSICDVTEEVIDYLNAHGQKVGLIKVRLYRPWRADKMLACIPETCKSIAVLDRTKEPGAQGEPLYMDVVTSLANAGTHRHQGHRRPLWPRQQGHSSRERLRRLQGAGQGQPEASVHRRHRRRRDPRCPCARLPLPTPRPKGTVSCMFWGLGGDGTVGANKNSIKIIGDHTDKYVQAYFQYDSKKTGGVTISHLRFGDKPIKSPYYINKADFVACHNPSYITKGFKMAQKLKAGGTFLVNCQWTFEELEHHLDAEAKRYIAKNKIKLVMINAIDLADQDRHGQAYQHHPAERLLLPGEGHSRGRGHQVHEGRRHSLLPEEGPGCCGHEPQGHRRWAPPLTLWSTCPKAGLNAVDDTGSRRASPAAPATVKMVTEILDPVDKMDGDSLPVSAFTGSRRRHLRARRLRLREARRCRLRA